MTKRERVGLFVLWLLLVVVLALVAVSPLSVRAGVATEIIINVPPYPTYPSCADGSPIGSTASCPVYTTAGGPTPTPDPYNLAVFAEDGSTKFAFFRGFTLADVYIAGVLTVAVLVLVVWFLTAQLRGR